MKIRLEAPWIYRTALVTIDYPAGDHEVADDIHAAAVKAGAHKEADDGNGDAADRPPRAARKAKG